MISDPTTLPCLLTVDEVADLLRISRDAAYQRIARGQLPGVCRLGKSVRVRRDVLLRAVMRGVGK